MKISCSNGHETYISENHNIHSRYKCPECREELDFLETMREEEQKLNSKVQELLNL